MTRKLVIPAVAAFFVVTWVAAARSQTQGPTSLGFKKRFVIEVRNPGPVALESYPIVLSVETIRAFAPDFNSFNYAIFDEAGGGYQLVPSQADDLDRDRAHEEIVFIRTLPASSTTRLACYYSAKGAFQLMMSTPKAGARLLGGGPAGILAGWESNLAGFKFVDGRVEAYGKLYPGLVLSKAAKDDAKLQEWGLDILAGGGSLGLGGLSAWEGGTAVPLAGAGAGGGFTVQRTVLASGPLRALVKVEYSSPLPGARGSGTVVLFSAFADNIFCRQDIHPGPGAGRRGVYGVSLQKLTAEDVSFDKSRGLLSAWGRGSEAAGEVGLAVLFDPSDLAGLDENGPARTVKLNIKPGRKLTVWTVAGWGRGIVTAAAPAAKNWARLAADLGLALRAPVEVRFAKR